MPFHQLICFHSRGAPGSIEAPDIQGQRSSHTATQIIGREPLSSSTSPSKGNHSREDGSYKGNHTHKDLERCRNGSMKSPFSCERLTGWASQSSGASLPLVSSDTPVATAAPNPVIPSPLPLASLELCRGAFKMLHQGETPKRAAYRDVRSKWQSKRLYLTILSDVTEEASQSPSPSGKGPSSLQSR